MTGSISSVARAAALCVLMAQGSVAGEVTLHVMTTNGAPAENAVIVFDPPDATTSPSRDTATIDQIDKQFVPLVTVIRTGTAVTFPNRDQIRHQVYSFSPAKTFTLKLYAGSPKTAVVFDKPGLVVLGCNIHDKMLAFVAVVNSPYFVKIPASGTATLNLPPGHYGLRVWHPQLGKPAATTAVDIQNAPFSLALDLDLRGNDAVAAWH
jgi:plastocyanin